MRDEISRPECAGGAQVLRGFVKASDFRTLPTAAEFGAMLRQGSPLVCCIFAVISSLFAATNLATGKCLRWWTADCQLPSRCPDTGLHALLVRCCHAGDRTPLQPMQHPTSQHIRTCQRTTGCQFGHNWRLLRASVLN